MMLLVSTLMLTPPVLWSLSTTRPVLWDTPRPWRSRMALLMCPPGKPPPRRLLPSRPLPPLELLDPLLDHPTLDLLSDHPTPEPSAALLQLPTEDQPALLDLTALSAALPALMNLL